MRGRPERKPCCPEMHRAAAPGISGFHTPILRAVDFGDELASVRVQDHPAHI